MRPRVAKTTINDTYDFAIGKRLTHLPALREIGFSANRRLLRVQRLSHDPTDGADALAAITDPVTTASGQRVPGLRFTDPRVQALLSALCVFRLLPRGFAHRDLRRHLAPQLGLSPEAMASGQITYDLRRLRVHGLTASRAPTATRSPTPGCGTHCSSPAPTPGCCAPGWPRSTAPRSRPSSAPLHAPTRPRSPNSPEQPASPPDHNRRT
jgi:hypothetical protein